MSYYENGLSFECQRCGYCCRHEPGLVLFSARECVEISTYLKISHKKFLEDYCKFVQGGLGPYYSIKEKDNFDCIFWDQGCTIYPVRPTQCRTYPFWPNIVDSKQHWESEREFCPGINTGPLIEKKHIEKCLNDRERENCLSSEDEINY